MWSMCGWELPQSRWAMRSGQLWVPLADINHITTQLAACCSAYWQNWLLKTQCNPSRIYQGYLLFGSFLSYINGKKKSTWLWLYISNQMMVLWSYLLTPRPRLRILQNFSTNGAGRIGFTHAKSWTKTPTSHLHKNHLKIHQESNLQRLIKLLEENTEKT